MSPDQAKEAIADARHALLPLLIAVEASWREASDGAAREEALGTPPHSSDRVQIAMQLTSLVADVSRILSLLLGELACADAHDDLRKRLAYMHNGLQDAQTAWMP